MYVGRIRNVHILSNLSFIKSVEPTAAEDMGTVYSDFCMHQLYTASPCVVSALSGPYCTLCSLCSGSNDERGVVSATPSPNPPIVTSQCQMVLEIDCQFNNMVPHSLSSPLCFSPLQLQSLNAISITRAIETYKYELIQGNHVLTAGFL